MLWLMMHDCIDLKFFSFLLRSIELYVVKYRARPNSRPADIMSSEAVDGRVCHLGPLS
jgi:hypothetical protein